MSPIKDLSELKLNQFPMEICRLTHLAALILDRNPLTALPTEIGQLTNLRVLGLFTNALTCVPKEIGRLTNLTVLSLSDTKLSSLPEEIWKLTRLTTLHLGYNKLPSLPTDIGLLTQLTTLSLTENNYTLLPTQIGHLTKLTELALDRNRLAALPTEICRLTQLTKLFLNTNQLRALPNSLGNLVRLIKLTVEDNPSLQELPLTLGQIPGLTDINIDRTGIAPAAAQAILNQCRSLRDAKSADVLPLRLEKWKIAKIELSEEQKKILNEWLLRLEKTVDYIFYQSELEHIVSSILADLPNKEFQELFFSQAEANNARCEDRTAMSLNEIYTSWMILCQSAGLELLTGVAKTLCLRHELQKMMGKEPESVEIFLYYESMLRERLQLVTAVKLMAHHTSGIRFDIDEDALVKTVNEHFFTHLLSIPVFEKMAKEALQEEWKKIAEEAQKKLTDRPPGDELSEAVLTWGNKQGQVMQEKERASAECVKKWYEAICANSV